MADDRLKTLKTRLGQIKSQLTRFSNFLVKIQDNLDPRVKEIPYRLSKVDGLFGEFESIWEEIETLDDENVPDVAEHVQYEDLYYAAVARANELAPVDQSDNVSISTGQRVNNNSSVHSVSTLSHVEQTTPHFNIKLPQLSLPEFSGAYDKWAQFYDTFRSLIHENPTLNKIQKFYYLQAALKGEAAHVIQALEVSEANYNCAWELLKTRFENKKVILKTHMKNIFELSAVTKDSYTSLRHFLDSFQKDYRALKNLGEPVDEWSSVLIYLLTSKLDINSKKEWEIKTNCEVSPKIDAFVEFLTDRCHLLESLDSRTTIQHGSNSNSTYKKSHEMKSQSHLSTQNNYKCILCEGSHRLFQCKDFLDLSVSDRFREVRRLKACANCLKQGHTPQDCFYGPCRICNNKKHNTLLHINNSESRSNISHSNPSQSQSQVRSQNHTQSSTSFDCASTQAHIINEESNSTLPISQSQGDNTINTHCMNNTPFVLLSTAQVYVYDRSGNPVICRILLDNGSQSCFLSASLCDRLNLKREKIKIPVTGINSMCTNISHCVKTTIKSRVSNFQVQLNFLIIDQITSKIPQRHLDVSSIKFPQHITLADPDYYKPGNIDALLGAGVFYDLMLSGQIKTHKNGPIVQNTKLGWIVSGQLHNYQEISVSCNVSQMGDIHNQLEKFWLIEETDKKQVLFSKEEQEVENHFVENFTKNVTGRFIVRLPVRENYSLLGDNFQNAVKRFYSLERKFLKDDKLHNDYSSFMQEYIDMGHMSPVDPVKDTSGVIHYLPHHFVKKETSLTTKLRVVFDASSKSQSNLSLNDVLKTGPSIQDDIFAILLRFRIHNVVFTADIAKMYRQILVDERDRNKQRIVWRSDTSQELTHYKLNTITYGTSPASFLATRCLRQLAVENQDKSPEASCSIERDFYMDDWIGGSSDTESALKLIKEVSEILMGAGFPLRQWISNDLEVLQSLSSNSSDLQYNIKDSQISNKTLGILWSASQDVLHYKTTSRALEMPTKRKILSTIAQIFDVLGLINPVVLTSKLILQKLWQIKSDWDEPVPEEIQVAWSKFFDNLSALETLEIPRQVVLKNASYFELHCFSDASQSAYGTCIYVRSVNDSGDIMVRLLCAKSRVAPLKTISVPRLELCGALLTAQLSKGVLTFLNLNISKIVYWCDSSIVLSWIPSDPSQLKTFVSNRVSKIQTISDPNQWRYVPTSLNPADLVSRGVNPHEIKNLSLWWHGPSFLSHESEFWPPSLQLDNIELPEMKRVSLILAKTNEIDDISERFSSFKKMINVVAYLLRFTHNCRANVLNHKSGSLTTDELKSSIEVIVKMVQLREFTTEIKALAKSHKLPKSSKLCNLNPFLDKSGILRVGGRIDKSELTFESKHPMIIPSKHQLTTLIIRQEHSRNLHAGCQTVLASVRSRFWPLNGKHAVKRVLRSCVICFRVKPRFLNQIMGQLPTSRVVPSRPFSVCGIDFAGPFLIKEGKLRNRKLVKAYICVFVCFASKAVHLELVSDLSTESFLNALKRFTSRRGVSRHIYSDNGTNFVGAERHLKSFIEFTKEDQCRDYLTDSNITWHFIPPRTPHFGGLWESVVRSAKFHIKRTINSNKLTYEEFYTYLCQIECILNSRPLYSLTEDPDDINPLTPGHFLIGTALNALPEGQVMDDRSTHVSRYKHLRFLVQQFWDKWSKNYLNTMQQRTKWQFSNVPENLIGSLVVLHEDNCPPLSWKMGRIIDVHPGQDGLVRVVTIRTSKGVMKRAVTKISLLPIEI